MTTALATRTAQVATRQLKEVAMFAMTSPAPCAEIVLAATLNELETRLTTSQFVVFCAALEELV